MGKLMVCAVTVVVVGCGGTASLIRKLDSVEDGSGAPAPGGRVRYQVSSAKSVMAGETEAARAKMQAHCDGSYDVLREWDEHSAITHGLFWSQMYVYRYQEFRCVPADEIVRKVMSGFAPAPVAEAIDPPAPPDPLVVPLTPAEDLDLGAELAGYPVVAQASPPVKKAPRKKQ